MSFPDQELSPAKLRQRTAIALLVGAPVSSFLWAVLIGFVHSQFPWLLFVVPTLLGLTLGSAVLLHPSFGNAFSRFWQKLSALSRSFISTIALTLFFFAILTPVGLLRRAFRSRPARREVSYWKEPSPETSPDRYLKPY